MKKRIKNRKKQIKKDKPKQILSHVTFCDSCLEKVESPDYECKCDPDMLCEKKIIEHHDKYDRSQWPKLGRDITSEFIFCIDCGRNIDSNEPILRCSTDQSNTYNCPYSYGHETLCKDCVKTCIDCLTRYCNHCWIISIKKKDEYPCISHRHCKSCAKKPVICNVVPMSACGCGCGDYAPEELIWYNNECKTKYINYRNDKKMNFEIF